MKKEYSIGLDIGTTSVGWAVILKDNFKVMHKGNKALWGVRLFEEAKSANERRNFRGSRRRYDRRRQRIKLLQDEFQLEINKVDKDFFYKLQETFYVEEKDPINKQHPLTKEEKAAVKEYYKKFPTIYHLRNELMVNSQKQDIRLVYLAIHHIIKYRGNFLYDTNEFKVNNLNIGQKINEIFTDIVTQCTELELDEYYLGQIDYKKIEEILLMDSKNDLKRELKNYLNLFFGDYKKFADNFSKLICGNTFSIKDLFHLEIDEDLKISLKGSDFDDKYNEIEKLIENRISTLALMKELYDMIYLKQLFGDRENCLISPLMIDKYDEHREDLKDLKNIFDNYRKEYNQIFRTTEKNVCLYDKYVHNKITYDEFAKELQKHIDIIAKNVSNPAIVEKIARIVTKISNGNLLPRITSTENGKYPYQINKEELKLIIKNQGQYYPFLLEMINDEYKLVKILSFKIPYYVGPLIDSDKHKFAWMKRKIPNVKITPYNFDDVVDKEASAESFIERMLGHCTYLLEEPAMPNNSILYSEYKVLNELKQIRVNDQKLTLEFQHRLMDELFKKVSGTISDKKFKEFLIKSREFDMYKGDLTVKGYSANEKFANNMSSYIAFFGPNGFFENTNLTIKDAEKIIRWITIFEDKDILANKIEVTYPVLKPILKKLVNMKYSGWSNLSEKLLTTPYYYDEEISIKKSIMDLMWETDENFMQIINNDKYGFQKMIAEMNQASNNGKLNYQMVSELVTSPSTKRGIWQALQVTNEIVTYIGYEPSSITIEMARGDEKKQRKNDRKGYLNKIYTASKDSISEYNRLKGELNSVEFNKDNQKLFLYFIQEGKSLYSGKPLDITHLEQYEIDHILPRTIIKDDSIDNKALVLRSENQNKAASLVLPSEYRTYENKKWWEHLKNINLISAKKFYNLTRKEFKSEDIEVFINRQLVETRQITKHVANILQSLYKDSKIIYLPASLSHNYREKFELFKFRDLNDYHHAHDAYLNAILGEYKNYCNLRLNYDGLVELTNKLITDKKYKELKYGYIINSIDPDFMHCNAKTGEVLDIDKFTKTIEEQLYHNDILISKKTEIRTGELYNSTIQNKKNGRIPLKKNMPVSLYGGYTSVKPSYLVLVNYKGGNKLVGIPTLIAGKGADEIEKYLMNHLNSKNIKIIKNRIPFQTLVIYKEHPVYVTGYGEAHKACECANAMEIKIPRELQKKWKYAFNYLFNNYMVKIDEKDIINENELLDLFQQILDFLFNYSEHYPLYMQHINKIKERLNGKKLTKEEYCDLLKGIINLYNGNRVNLKQFGFNDDLARLSDKNITGKTIINKSVTGLWSRKYEF